ncbi:MAG: hypothetical protein NTX25_02515 [Proteobacteria bacterium]|nr:hypothetical protein [Pseudomonadota bacterium]
MVFYSNFKKVIGILILTFSGSSYAEQFIVDSWCYGPGCISQSENLVFEMVSAAPGITRTGNIITSDCVPTDPEPAGDYRDARFNFGYLKNDLNQLQRASGIGEQINTSLMAKSYSGSDYIATYQNIIGQRLNPHYRIERIITGKISTCTDEVTRSSYSTIEISCHSEEKYNERNRGQGLIDFGRPRTLGRRYAGVERGVEIGLIAIFDQDLSDCDRDFQALVWFKNFKQVEINTVEVRLWIID